MDGAMGDLDKAGNCPEGVEPEVWQHLCEYRRQKVENENLVSYCLYLSVYMESTMIVIVEKVLLVMMMVVHVVTMMMLMMAMMTTTMIAKMMMQNLGGHADDDDDDDEVCW